MGLFTITENVVTRVGAIIGDVAEDLGKKTEGWGGKADNWIEEQVQKTEDYFAEKEAAREAKAEQDAKAEAAPEEVNIDVVVDDVDAKGATGTTPAV